DVPRVRFVRRKQLDDFSSVGAGDDQFRLNRANAAADFKNSAAIALRGGNAVHHAAFDRVEALFPISPQRLARKLFVEYLPADAGAAARRHPRMILPSLTVRMTYKIVV